MKLKNNFNEEDRYLFADSHECWYCGQNSADSLHHIMGRGGPGSECESSILNAAPIHNFGCHLDHHGLITTKEWQKKFLKKTYNYLVKNYYQFTNKDLDFIIKYKDYYDNDIWQSAQQEKRQSDDL